jgi:serine protease inhibitor ecotin
MMRAEHDRKKIREFFELIESDKYDLRKYSKPVLVYYVDENKKVKYSLWENDMLNRFGIDNVDGWDYEEDIAFCPDWVEDEEEDDFDDDDDDF